MFVLDFDDTLFDTRAFKEARRNALHSLGVSYEVYERSYLLARNRSFGRVLYSDLSHAQSLVSFGFDYEAVYRVLSHITNKSHIFLYQDTLSFLSLLQKKGHRVLVLSLGDEVFQKNKIIGSGVDSFVDKVFTVSTTKKEVLENILTKNAKDVVYLVNDKIEETKELVASFPQLFPILKISRSIPREAYEQSGLLLIDNLSELFSLDVV